MDIIKLIWIITSTFVIIDAQGQTVRGDKSGKFQNWPTSAENSKVLE